jgi:hypothetical protein
VDKGVFMLIGGKDGGGERGVGCVCGSVGASPSRRHLHVQPFRIPNEAPEKIAASPSLLATLLVDHIELRLVLVPTG